MGPDRAGVLDLEVVEREDAERDGEDREDERDALDPAGREEGDREPELREAGLREDGEGGRRADMVPSCRAEGGAHGYRAATRGQAVASSAKALRASATRLGSRSGWPAMDVE